MAIVGKPFHIGPPAPLSADHVLIHFDSSVPALDLWLKTRARQNDAAGASRTFVVTRENRVVGYYSLAATSIMHSEATGKIRRNTPDPVPAVLIGRLALDKSLHGHGHGTSLLQDAVLRIAGASETVGIRAILVHAMSEEAKTFYERFGFRASPIDPMTLMITVAEIAKMLGGT